MAVSAPREITYPVARVFTALLTGGVFFLILALVGFAIATALTPNLLSVEQARAWMAVGLVCVPWFAGHSAAIGLLDGYAQGRFVLPAQARLPPPAASVQNPWRVALLSTLLIGLPASALSLWLLPTLWPAGIERARFVWCFAALSAVISAGIVLAWTGPHFLAQARVPAEVRAFRGSHTAYLWQRHVLPQALINLFINVWVGVAILPAALRDPLASVPRSLVVGDAVGSGLALLVAIGAGVQSYARFDRRWGVAPVMPGRRPRALWCCLALLGGALLMGPLTRGLYALFGLDAIGPWTFILGRGIACGLYCGAVAYWVARWTISPRP